MKIIYEQGDIVYNRNNFTYAVVMNDCADKVTILECGGKDVFTNCPPKSALKYCGHLDFKKKLRDMLLAIVEQDHPTKKGGEE